MVLLGHLPWGLGPAVVPALPQRSTSITGPSPKGGIRLIELPLRTT